MIAYKGFNKDLRSTYGNGKDKDCNFTPGETKKAPGAKTAREGFHCTEIPFECPGIPLYRWLCHTVPCT